jgi:LmbE family N-acetylglucosaminyl deacetylase
VSAAFDVREAGVKEQVWMDGRLDGLPRLAAPGAGDRLLIVAAHPDDESLGAGGLIATAAANGAEICLLVVSDGEASHPHSRTHSPAELATIRRGEIGAAMRELAPGATTQFLGLPDGAISAHPERLRAAIEERLEGCTHLASPWTGDRHPDHEACAGVAADLSSGCPGLRHWQFPIWAWHWADAAATRLPMAGLHRLDLGREQCRRKQAAIACHRSQHVSLSDEPGDEAILPPHVLDHFARDFESFVLGPESSTYPAANAQYFDSLYAESDDPWGLAERFYERRKRALVLACLTRERFRRAFEPGCATGLLTRELAKRCDELIAWDGASAVVERARAGLAALDNVALSCRRIPEDWPEGTFDLILLSEVGYYCVELGALADRVQGSLAADGIVLVCHWRHAAPDHPHGAADVHAAVGRNLHRLLEHVERDFRLEVFARDPRSVATVEGIVG